VFSQPVYDIKILERFFDATKDVKPVPFFIGILPLTSLKYAEFLNAEVPGMEVPKSIMDALKKASTKEAQQKVGMDVAKDSLKSAKSMKRIKGTYIFPPFGKYSAVEELMGIL
jgi:homocysteine S-methyltransferase